MWAPDAIIRSLLPWAQPARTAEARRRFDASPRNPRGTVAVVAVSAETGCEAVSLGRFPDSDAPAALATGFGGVAAWRSGM
jgi:hypothetical protein